MPSTTRSITYSARSDSVRIQPHSPHGLKSRTPTCSITWYGHAANPNKMINSARSRSTRLPSPIRRHYWQQSSCHWRRSDLRHAHGTQQADDPPVRASKNRSDARSNRPLCGSAASEPATAWCSRRVSRRKRPPASRYVLHCTPSLPLRKNLVHIYPAELRRDPRLVAAQPAETDLDADRECRG